MLECALGCSANKQALPAIARNGTHDHHIGFQGFGDLWQFFVRQPGDQVGVIVFQAMK